MILMKKDVEVWNHNGFFLYDRPGSKQNVQIENWHFKIKLKDDHTTSEEKIPLNRFDQL